LREITLPELSPRAGEAGLGLVRKFLREHPEQEARMAAHAGKTIARWAEDTKLDPTTRAQSLYHAVSWKASPGIRSRHPGYPDRARAVPGDLTIGAQQDALIDLAQGGQQEEVFLWRAIESRLPRLRDSGRIRLKALLGASFGRRSSISSSTRRRRRPSWLD